MEKATLLLTIFFGCCGYTTCARRTPVASWTFTSSNGGKDLSSNGDNPVTMTNMNYGRGPNNEQNGSVILPQSFAQSMVVMYPTEKLRFYRTMTYFTRVYLTGTKGAFFEYNTGLGASKGVQGSYLWMWYGDQSLQVENTGFNVEATRILRHNRWIDIAVVWDFESLSFFVDEILVKTVTGKSNLSQTRNGHLLFGYRPGNSDYFLSGRMACSQFFDVALTAAEVRHLACDGPQKVPPQISKGPGIVQGIEWHEASIACKASGKPLPTWEFFKDAEDTPLHNTERVIVDTEAGVVRFRPLHRTDEGRYRCKAINRFGQDEEEGELVVIVPPHITRLVNVTETEGQSVTLSCESEGNPTPKMTFRNTNNGHEYKIGVHENGVTRVYQGGPKMTVHHLQPNDNLTSSCMGRLVFCYFIYENGRILVSQKGSKLSLTVHFLNPNDTGIYTCTASNAGGFWEKNGTIVVKHKPRVQRKGNEIIPCEATMDVHGSPTAFLIDNAIFTEGVVFGFSAFFFTQSKVVFQIWRPIYGNSYKLVSYFEVEATKSRGRENIYIANLQGKSCVRVRNGDRLGIYNPESPGGICYNFDPKNIRRLISSNVGNDSMYDMGSITQFDGLTYPYRFSVAAYIKPYETWSPSSADFPECPHLVIPGDEPVWTEPAVTGTKKLERTTASTVSTTVTTTGTAQSRRPVASWTFNSINGGRDLSRNGENNVTMTNMHYGRGPNDEQYGAVILPRSTDQSMVVMNPTGELRFYRTMTYFTKVFLTGNKGALFEYNTGLSTSEGTIGSSLWMWYGDRSLKVANTGFNNYEATNVLTHDRWIDIAVVWNFRDLSFYVDGKLVTSETDKSNLSPTRNGYLHFGYRPGEDVEYFLSGKMACSQFFDVALTATEVRHLTCD